MSKTDEILKQYPYIGEDIQKAQAELNNYIALRKESIEKASDPLKAQSFSGMPHLPDGNVNDQTYEAVAEIIVSYQEQIKKCIKRINDLLDLKKWLDKAFESLTEDERRILYLKYDEHWQAWRIMQRMGIMDRHTFYKIVDGAKEKIKRILCL
jgi:DNA-directed RNA polymerase specialized sigma subunit